MLQLGLILSFALLFILVEYTRPGRTLPMVTGWYARAAFFNVCQLVVTILASLTWNRWLQGASLFDFKPLPPIVQGFVGWFIGTFVFYWWHVLRHKSTFLWRTFHQIHHSPSRIETITAFYKHPIEIAADSILASALMLALLGVSTAGMAWFNVFAAIGEYFYHANIKTPSWIGLFIQRPEYHSIHHQLDVHNYNYSDLPIWDRLFGTFRDTKDFSPACGFPPGKEQKVGRMLLFKENYN